MYVVVVNANGCGAVFVQKQRLVRDAMISGVVGDRYALSFLDDRGHDN